MKYLIASFACLLSLQVQAHGPAENRAKIGMEEKSIAYLGGLVEKREEALPLRPFTPAALMDDEDFTAHDLVFVPYATGVKMVPAGQIVETLNQVELALNQRGFSLSACNKSALLMTFIKNRNLSQDWQIPACRRKLS